MLRPLAVLALSLLAACAAPPPPPPPPAPTAAPAAPTDDSGARDAVDAALRSLSKRNYDVAECAPGDFEHADEAKARAGVPLRERCTLLVAHLPDRTWLVVIRAATTQNPARGGGGQRALVTVTPGAEGVKRIEYAK